MMYGIPKNEIREIFIEERINIMEKEGIEFFSGVE
ncbi:MAG: hypothetical protein Ct9H90mP4_01060 [Gammaproteobacteria bacterium]|nr:MAG: hypothetical protein Ct9H90mP4_01060 [Gammaproteobacteria bacterium]